MDWSSAGSNPLPAPLPGSWRPFEAPLRIEPRRSREALLRLIVAYAGGGLALALLAAGWFPPGLQLAAPAWLAGAAFFLAGILLELRSWLAGPLPAGVRCLEVTGRGVWRACAEDGTWTDLELTRVLGVSPAVIRLRLRPPGGPRGFTLELPADSLMHDTHRRLRVRLAWTPRAGSKVGRIPGYPST